MSDTVQLGTLAAGSMAAALALVGFLHENAKAQYDAASRALSGQVYETCALPNPPSAAALSDETALEAYMLAVQAAAAKCQADIAADNP
jgi:hypothetical protein